MGNQKRSILFSCEPHHGISSSFLHMKLSVVKRLKLTFESGFTAETRNREVNVLEVSALEVKTAVEVGQPTVRGSQGLKTVEKLRQTRVKA